MRVLAIHYKEFYFYYPQTPLAESLAVLPVFLSSVKLNQGMVDTPSVDYRLACANRFNEQLQSQKARLLTWSGDLLVLKKWLHHYQIDTVWMMNHHEPHERLFQEDLRQMVTDAGCAFVGIEGFSAVPLQKVLKKDHTPYLKFSAFYKTWLTHLNYSPKTQNTQVTWIDHDGDQHPKASGQADAVLNEDLEHFTLFAKGGLSTYERDRDYPALQGTSQLSGLLNHGALPVHHVIQTLSKLWPENLIQPFIRQLAWRDFMMACLMHFPYSETSNFNHLQIKWENDQELFLKWTKGETGYPLVDAAMIQLLTTGRMHNRLRMVVASFLTKDLLIDWTWGAEWFKKHLYDYDLALNMGNWQWAASTGVDSVPYFRVFNPVTQSKRFDHAGSYIKTFVPQLADVPSKAIHFPWDHQVTYHPPIVDHAFARKRALMTYKGRT